MLNYIWAALIIFALLFALVADLGEARRDTFRNGQPLPVTLRLKQPYSEAAREWPVEVVIDPGAYGGFYHTGAHPAGAYAGTLTRTGTGYNLRFAKDVALPEPLSSVRETLQSDYDAVGELRGRVSGFQTPGADAAVHAAVTLDAARFHHMGMITKAAIFYSKSAVSIALGLIGVLALWLGLLRIAEKSGLVNILVKIVQPVLHPLFPEIPKGHPALGMVAINLSAGMLGLGNAATPMGLKAMEELQKLNPQPETATNPMVMLLALNTTCVQLVPSPTLLAILGLGAAEVWLPTVLATAGAMVIAILATKLIGRFPGYRSSDPNRNPMPEPAAA